MRKTMHAPPQKARIPKSRKNLRNALLRLLASTAFDQISIRDIAAEADVGYTTFFRHYPSKDALLDDVAGDEIAQLTAHTVPVYDTRDSQAACLALCSFVHEHRHTWSALLTGGAAGMVRKELLRQGLNDSANRRIGNPTLPHDLALRLAIGSMLEVLSWWLQQPDPLPVANVADIMARISIAPLEAQAAAKPDTPPRRRKPGAGRR